MKRQLIAYLTAALLMLTLSTCKKDDPDCETCQYEQGFQQVKDWMYFKTGSYWIYEEENSGAIDTLTVYEDWQGIAQEENDAFLTHTISSFDGFFYFYQYNSSFTIHCLTEPSCDCEKVLRAKGKPGNFVGEGRMFFFPPIVDNYTGSDGLSEVVEVIENYMLSTGEEANTGVFRTENNASEDFQETKFYISRHIGVVRKELLDDNEIWNLIEYDVTQ